VNHIHSLGAFIVLGVGGIVASCVILLVWFRRSGFFE
jgi:hypothetical protein